MGNTVIIKSSRVFVKEDPIGDLKSRLNQHLYSEQGNIIILLLGRWRGGQTFNTFFEFLEIRK